MCSPTEQCLQSTTAISYQFTFWTFYVDIWVNPTCSDGLHTHTCFLFSGKYFIWTLAAAENNNQMLFTILEPTITYQEVDQKCSQLIKRADSFQEKQSSIYTWTSIYHPSITFNLHTWTVAIASTPPEAPSKWPIMDFVELTFSCTKSTNNLLYSTHHNNLPQHETLCETLTRSMLKCRSRAWIHSKQKKYLMASSCNSNFTD